MKPGSLACTVDWLLLQGVTFELESVESPMSPISMRSAHTLHSSSFKRYYDVAKAPADSTAMWRALEQLLRAYCVVEQLSWEGEGAVFLQRLQGEARQSSDAQVCLTSTFSLATHFLIQI